MWISLCSLCNFLHILDMEDPLRKHLAKLKVIKESAHRRAEMYSDLSKLDDKHAMHSLGALNKAPSPGKKIPKNWFYNAMDSRTHWNYMCSWGTNDYSWSIS